MKRNLTLPRAAWAITLLGIPIANGVVQAQEKVEKTATPSAAAPKCPVTGEPVNLAISTPTPEGPVFFCCKDCIAKYKSEPTKYADATAAQRSALATRPKTQVKCPVSGDSPDPKISIEKNGQKIRFCSDACRKKYASEPEKYASALANSYTYQTKCPVMDEPIDPAVFSTLPGGETIYLCCKGCDKKLLGDPAKYAPALKQMGFTFDFPKPKKEDK